MASQCSNDSTSYSAARRRNSNRQLVAPLKVDLSACKYELLRLIAARLGWQVVPVGSADSAWDLYWTDTSISQERLLRLAPTQRINHFHGMLELCRKRPMAKALTALAAAAPASACYDFFPPTWQLPNQLGEFITAAKAAGKKRTFIVKPDAGCQGKGIRLLQGGSENTVLKSLAGMTTLQAVAQEYVPEPYLVNGLKFDLRVYVLVADVDPLRIYIFREGLVRFCTAPYKKPTPKNLACTFMHLTNYAINKRNPEAFIMPSSVSSSSNCGPFCDPDGHAGAGGSGDLPHKAEGAYQHCRAGNKQQAGTESAESASKWSFRQLRQHLEGEGHSWTCLWSAIGQLVVKALLAVAPQLAATYKATVVSNTKSGDGGAAACSSPRSNRNLGNVSVSSAAVATSGCRCFEILGFDVLLDASLKPWLIEVNHSPSFNVDSGLDMAIKEQLIVDAIKLVRIEPGSIAAAKKAARRATQARLVAAPPARGSSSLTGAWPYGTGGVCASQARAAQQAQREAVVAARDRWQLKHLGGFERLYPVPLPGMQQSPAGGSSAFSTSKLQELAQLQETYVELLTLSQQVHLHQRQHQQLSPVKLPSYAVMSDCTVHGSCQHQSVCPSGQQHQQQVQLAGINDTSASRPGQHHLACTGQQQLQQQKSIKVDDTADGVCRRRSCTSPQLCAASTQQVSVAAALAVLSTALSSPDEGCRSSQVQCRPSSASSQVQCRPSSASSQVQCRPSSASSQVQYRPSSASSQVQYRPSSASSQVQYRPSSASSQVQCSSSTKAAGHSGLQSAGSSKQNCYIRPQSSNGSNTVCNTPVSDLWSVRAGSASAGVASGTQRNKHCQSSSGASSSMPAQMLGADSVLSQRAAGSTAPAVRPRPHSAPRLRGGHAAACSTAPSGMHHNGTVDRVDIPSSSSGRTCSLRFSSWRKFAMANNSSCLHAADQRCRASTAVACTTAPSAGAADACSNPCQDTVARAGAADVHTNQDCLRMQSSSRGRIRGMSSRGGSSTGTTISSLASTVSTCCHHTESTCCNHIDHSIMHTPGKGVIAAATLEAAAAIDQTVASAAGELVRGAVAIAGRCLDSRHTEHRQTSSTVLIARSSSVKIELANSSNSTMNLSVPGYYVRGALPGGPQDCSAQQHHQQQRCTACQQHGASSCCCAHSTQPCTHVGRRGHQRIASVGEPWQRRPSEAAAGIISNTACPWQQCNDNSTILPSALCHLQLGTAQGDCLAVNSSGRNTNTQYTTPITAPGPRQLGSGAAVLQGCKVQQMPKPSSVTQQFEPQALLQQWLQYQAPGNGDGDAGLNGVGFGQQRLLRHCSAGGLLGRLELADAVNKAPNSSR